MISNIKCVLILFLIFIPWSVTAQDSEPEDELAEKYEKLGVLKRDENTVIFIPKDYKPKGRKANFVVWFGEKQRTAEQDLKEFRLAEQLVHSEISAILVIPRNHFDVDFSTKKTLKCILPKIEENKSLGIDKVVFAGYGLGEQQMAQLIHKKRFKPHEIWIFNANWELENYRHWLVHHRKTRFLNIYTDAEYTKSITDKMLEQNIKFANIDEEDCTLGKLEKYPVIHIFSEVAGQKTPYLTGSFYKFILTSPVL